MQICKENGVLTIADEVMTGFGKTGKIFATDYLVEKPDMMCLSKSIDGTIWQLRLYTRVI
jgi:adenosylmethionine-8-amino-7-oxononanoate aminotransferase